MEPKTAAEIADYKKLNDEELVYRFVHRHENIALDILFERYGHLVFGICLKYASNALAAQEKTESIFIALTQDLKKFNSAGFKLWLYNYVNDQFLNNTENTTTLPDNTGQNDGMSFYHSDVTDAELQLLEESMITLNKTEQDCISLFYMSGMTYAQIAQEKQISASEVKMHIRSGIETIKNNSGALKNVKQ